MRVGGTVSRGLIVALTAAGCVASSIEVLPAEDAGGRGADVGARTAPDTGVSVTAPDVTAPAEDAPLAAPDGALELPDALGGVDAASDDAGALDGAVETPDASLLPDALVVADSAAACDPVPLASAFGRVAEGSTVGAPARLSSTLCTPRPGEARAGGGSGERVYRWTAPEAGSFVFDTLGSVYDTLLSVRRGSCDGDELACNDEASGVSSHASQVTVTLRAGDVVVLAVDGAAGAEGSFVLNIARGAPACSPMCAGRVCGADGCGGSCGACAGGLVCSAAGRCEAPVDTRPPAERACPRGATLRVELWRVTATPTNTAGEPWDGLSSGETTLRCMQTAAGFRALAVLLLRARLGGLATTLVDYAFGDWFQSSVTMICGAASDWFTRRYAGPDLYAVGFSNSTPVWQTPALQDSWIAPSVGGAWSVAVWRVPCQSTTPAIAFALFDEDLVSDDIVEYAHPFTASVVPPSVICDGWGFLDGMEGMTEALVRFTVEGATPSCAGISSGAP